MTAAICAPLAAPGYLLIRDAVSTPRSYLTDAALGVGEAAPRAVPQDFFIAVMTVFVDGGVLVKALLAAGLWLAGWGAARLAAHLVPTAGLPGELVAATIAIWNPYVAERLLQGHWSLLVGYGCLPWIALTVTRLRATADVGTWCALAFWIALAGLTPTGAVLALIVGLAAAAPQRRITLGVAGISLLAAMPWLVASGLGTAIPAGDAAGVHAFAARAEPGLGTLGSLASLGGMWNAEAVPASRTTLFALAFSAVLIVAVVVGVVVLRRTRAALGLLSIAVAAVVFPALLATGPGLTLTTWLITEVPGLGILRDGQKWVALAMPGYAVAGAAAITAVRQQSSQWLAAGLSCAALVLTLPDLAWGVGGRVESVTYPGGWSAIANRINAEPHPVAVLPPETLRQYPWAPSSIPVLDPFPRWVRADVVTSGDLWVDGQNVRGDGRRGRRAEELLRAGAGPRELADEGVGWVVVQAGTPGDQGLSSKTLAQLEPTYRDGDITLYRVPGPWTPIGASPGRRAAAIAAHLVWAALLAAGAVAAGLRLRHIRHGLRTTQG
ncbi:MULTISPECIES: hypothetical protein [unclassified Mycobacteroides]|uniref:hypothetical protein n=1 Tax=unclassified Mycobacteroides TaxID=2618759 RepID=UPI001327E1FD|nr:MULTISPECIES: hypothetical protein [unclassified Mycobacteroides]MUM19081.1 hypothetical protein [Mycobacteroides sp. CBMA 326]